MPPRRAIINGEVVDLPDTEQEPAEGSQLREGEGEGEGSQLREGEGEGERQHRDADEHDASRGSA